MTTTVSIAQADLRRSLSPDMFDDILSAAGVPLEVPSFSGSGLLFSVTFAAGLAPATVTAVRDRLLSVDAAQEAQRAEIRALIGADPSPLARALARNVLGD